MVQVADPVDRRVSTVSVLLGVAAVACFVDAIAAASRLVAIAGASDAVLNAAHGASQDGAELVASARSSTWFNGVVAIVGLLVLAGLAFAVRRRARRSRGGVVLGAAALAGVLLFGAAADRGTDATPDATQPEALRAALEQLTPAWYAPTHSVFVGVAVIGVIAAAIAVTRVSSIDFYR